MQRGHTGVSEENFPTAYRAPVPVSFTSCLAPASDLDFRHARFQPEQEITFSYREGFHMLVEELLLWLRGDSSRRRNDEEGTRMIQRLQELAASEEGEPTKAIAAKFPGPPTRENY